MPHSWGREDSFVKEAALNIRVAICTSVARQASMSGSGLLR